MSEHRETSSRPSMRTIQRQLRRSGNVSAHKVGTIIDSRQNGSPISSNITATNPNSTYSRRRSDSFEALTAKPETNTSRAAQRRTSSPNNMSSVNYTRTGRVSKAKKGLKVHNCECGRSYTRAEHLRRHQRNHAQEGAMVCRYANCGKTFYRSDLLQRHEERHDELGCNVSRLPSVSGTEPSTYPSPSLISTSLPLTSSTTSPAGHYPHQPPNSPQPEVSRIPRYNSPQFRTPQLPRTPKVNPAKTNHFFLQSNSSFMTPPNSSQHAQKPGYLARHLVSGPTMVDGIATSGGWAHESFAPSPYSCSSGYASPVPGSDYGHMYATPPYGPSMVRTRASSNASFIEQNWSQTSRSPTSTVSMPYPWPNDEKTIIAPIFPYSQVSYSPNDMSVHTDNDTMANYGHYEPQDLGRVDNEEGVQLFPGNQYGTSHSAHLHPFEHWLNNYWRFFHPTFPVLHRPTFAGVNAPSMLSSAIAAIGAYYSNDVESAWRIHDSCMQLLAKRQHTDSIGCDRQCDLQAIFLVEVFALYFARRSARTLSVHFLAMYNQLNLLRSADPSVAVTTLLHDSTDEDSLHDQWLHWVKLSARHRLLVSCYLLESQLQPMLVESRASPSLKIIVGDLHFPSHESLWEAPGACQWWGIAQENSEMPRCIGEAVVGQVAGCYDNFQSSVLIAAFYGPFGCWNVHLQISLEQFLSSDMTTQQQLAIAKLVHLAPIRALLAVSGGSWILGTKVKVHEEFAAHEATCRSWVAQLWSTPASGNPQLALEVLRLAAEILIQSLDTQKWFKSHFSNKLGLFYAALVLWSAAAGASRSCFVQQNKPLLSLQSNPAIMLPETNAAIVPVYSPSSDHLPDVQRAGPEVVSDRRSSMPHDEIAANASKFLLTVIEDITQSNVAACQIGCKSLLLWTKIQLCCSHINDQCDSPLGPVICDSHGGLIHEIIGHIERMLSDGWKFWSL